jgi:peptidoglycan/LPS O-acetylase OafA/YrhL
VSIRLAMARIPRLGDRFSANDNAFGVLRLTLAICVLTSHAWPVGYAESGFGPRFTRNQTDLGSMALDGFFVLSGFLVTISGLRSSWLRFAWYRAVRILPGLWACLLFTAFVVAPVVARIENGSLAGFWQHQSSPFDYVRGNWFGAMNDFSISGLLAHTPYGHVIGGPSAFDGSLWTLHYEYICYVGVAVLSATTILRRSPRFVLLLLGCAFSLIMFDLITAPNWSIRPIPRGAIGPFPLIGAFAWNWTLYLGFMFLLGVVARLYLHRLPMHGALALVAVGVIVATWLLGGWVAFGVPAWGYILLYLAVALPKWLRGNGRAIDYSYGMYIYAFPLQQLFALIGITALGIVAYDLMTIAATLLLAMASWHFIERPALQLRNIDPRLWWRWLAAARPVAPLTAGPQWSQPAPRTPEAVPVPDGPVEPDLAGPTSDPAEVPG